MLSCPQASNARSRRRAGPTACAWCRPYTRGGVDGCVFCEIVRGESPSWRVYEDESAYAFLNIFPASEWHTLVIPKAHYVDVFDAPVAELVAVIRAVKSVVDLYRRVIGISDVQIINSSGAQAQQDVFHVHFHIVPRRRGDGQDVTWSCIRSGGIALTACSRCCATEAPPKQARVARTPTSRTSCTRMRVASARRGGSSARVWRTSRLG
jgi:histidine triad (HIT) family protein